jgi:hypothetical protein
VTGTILLLGACLLTGYLLLVVSREMLESHATRSWSSTTGLVVETKWITYEARRRKGRNKKAERAEIRYIYRADGRQYESKRIQLRNESWSHFQSVVWLQRYPPGARPQVYYDPHDPSEAVLEPGISVDTWLWFASLTAITSFLVYQARRELAPLLQRQP